MTVKRYKLDENDTIQYKGKTLYRVVVVTPFKNPHGVTMQVGDKGGYIEKEDNLPQNDTAWCSCTFDPYPPPGQWIYSIICDNAVVSNGSYVDINGVVCDNAVLTNKGTLTGRGAIIGGDAHISCCALNGIVSIMTGKWTGGISIYGMGKILP